MRLIARHQISDETFRIKSGNDLPTLWRSIGAGKLQSVDGRCVTDLARLIKETVRWHVRIDVDAARGIEMLVMPGNRVVCRLATCWCPGRPADRPSPCYLSRPTFSVPTRRH